MGHGVKKIKILSILNMKSHEDLFNVSLLSHHHLVFTHSGPSVHTINEHVKNIQIFRNQNGCMFFSEADILVSTSPLTENVETEEAVKKYISIDTN